MTFPTATGSSQKLKGTPFRSISIPSQNPAQQELMNTSMAALQPHVGQTLGNIGQMAAGGTPEQWRQLEAPAMRQFSQLQGNIGSRYAGMGSGALHSSAFQNEMSEGAQSLAERLQSQRLGFQTQARQQLMEMINALLGKETMHQGFLEEQRPIWKQLLMNLSGGATQGAGSLGTLLGLHKMGLI